MLKAKATIKEIAGRAEVSIGTVDRVIHGRGGVSRGTRTRIEAIIDELGYQPDPLARQLSLGRRYLIAVLLPEPEQDSGYWNLCLAGLCEGSRSLAASRVEVEVQHFDRDSGPSFREAFARVLSDRPDGLLLAPLMPDLLRPALDSLPLGLPYAFFDGNLDGAHPVASVGQDALAAGRLAGRMLDLLAPPGSALAVLAAHVEDRHIRERIMGFSAHFAGSGRGGRSIVEVDVAPAAGLKQALEGAVPGVLAMKPPIGGILVPNSSGHIVGEWFEARGIKDKPALVTWDLVEANEAGLRRGSIDCVISQRPEEQARRALACLFETVKGGMREPSPGPRPIRIDLPIDTWLRESLPGGAGS